MKNLGGKFGYSVCGTLKISKMGELQKFSKTELQNKFDEKNGYIDFKHIKCTPSVLVLFYYMCFFQFVALQYRPWYRPGACSS